MGEHGLCVFIFTSMGGLSQEAHAFIFSKGFFPAFVKGALSMQPSACLMSCVTQRAKRTARRIRVFSQEPRETNREPYTSTFRHLVPGMPQCEDGALIAHLCIV